MQHSYSLVIMSIDYPKTDCVALIKKMREAKPIPILILSKKTDIDLKVTSLLYGADDYLIKPFDMEECLARVKAQIRRYISLGTDIKYSYVLYCGHGLTIDWYAQRVMLLGRELNLSQRQFEMLYHLASNSGQVFSRGQLYNLIWGEMGINIENSISLYISKLRKKLGDSAENQSYIKTIRGVGYRFTNEVHIQKK